MFVAHKTIAGRTLLLAALILTGGCTTFNEDWKKSTVQTPPPDTIEGCWQGVWASDVTHHTDQLRCMVTRKSDGTYSARFHANYHTVLSFGYIVPLKIEPETNGFHFSGEADLGWYAGGIYHYEGHADATNFVSTYSCKYDHGTFKMDRP